MYGLFGKLALKLYKWACIHKIRFPSAGQVESDLAKLHPGENAGQLCTEYYVGKLAKSFMVGLASVLLAIVVVWQAKEQSVLGEGGELARGGYGEEMTEVEVECEIDRQVQKFTIELGAQVYKEEEIQALFQEFCNELGSLILGNNSSLNEVTEDLLLWESYEGYPFYLEWESKNADIVHSDGTIVRGYEEALETEISVLISYEEWEWTECFCIRVLPLVLTEEERAYKEIERMILQREVESRSEKTLKLPERWQGKELEWKEKIENHGTWILAAGFLLSIGIFLLADKDLHDTVERRKLQIQKEYPDMVHKLTLYLGAGITIRGAFQRLAEEYEKTGRAKQRASPVYEEVLHTCRELKAGVSEGAAYEHFGKRTGVQEYVRLCTLLVQNLKKGNSTLMQRLREETQRALLEQLQYGKRLCEEAVTKLLLPMVLMLLVVMLMIMIPAFSTMGV